jgi:hypothetical protein
MTSNTTQVGKTNYITNENGSISLRYGDEDITLTIEALEDISSMVSMDLEAEFARTIAEELSCTYDAAHEILMVAQKIHIQNLH